MQPTSLLSPMSDQDREITATVMRERSRLGGFIRRRVADAGEAEDILQEVFYEFVQAYRLPEPIEQVSAWLFRVARNRIIDRFRKKKEEPLPESRDAEDLDGADQAWRLDLLLPASEDGPEAAYARAALITALQEALEELPEAQREVFIAHELDGKSFKEMAADSGTSLNTLLARKRYAVLHLRERLQAVYDELEM
ncbi:RNA polymerase sigma-70 factor, ECF subfamily (sigma-24) transcription regulator protein [Herbaspirillum frisingense GSF30]|uniref:RNA polymerase sigma-70 factor, ECF subfamily (Sigma-24) transcription regulator protein n=1 Tax=Herbaspirillum frisingense GSF30 TaxID=864073 RepID=A0AAI9N2S2_9BURK|nr:sigma-70 family RNA polymerase sigma factor [Herbaspirillum frisingense]EOA03696.1 RNA polymerase sigma-70 factor, ECF subfamily (sigma-24) transcription regulator protein [Herbaspirillum frisingense GSF30]